MDSNILKFTHTLFTAVGVCCYSLNLVLWQNSLPVDLIEAALELNGCLLVISELSVVLLLVLLFALSLLALLLIEHLQNCVFEFADLVVVLVADLSQARYLI